ncbi:MAG: tRNA epoxyqueuosine(34) reductase QueG [Saprospirales bacterium]|nr:tRNA epoxyqueuosine(34) reductase QueG [Saprospirales bacterium]
MNHRTQHTHFLKQEAQRLGFSFVGVSRAERMDEEARRLEEWLSKGFHGKMGYMENHFDKRIDPRELVPGAKSVVSLLYNYFTEKKQEDPTAPKLSMYAYGEDYHHVVRDKLHALLDALRQQVGEVEGRCFVDSAPVLERDWAKRSGIGWIGKNTLLIHPRAGSHFFLAELIIDLELEPDGPIKDYCGTCRRCIEACPTEAISPEGYLLDASKCISYLTIELKEAIPEEFKDKMDDWMFGCDVCQQVCPWNRFSQPHSEPAFEPHPDLLSMTNHDWQELTEEVFGRVFKRSAVRRAKYRGIMRNIIF